MNIRLKIFLRLIFIGSPMKRVEYLKRNNVFHHIGKRCMIMSRKVPLYSKLISLGNNVWVASGVKFITHDVCHYMLNGVDENDDFKYKEKIGCIEIGNNVFIGADSMILYDVKIGSNVVIGGGLLSQKIFLRMLLLFRISQVLELLILLKILKTKEKKLIIKVVYEMDLFPNL